MKFTEEQYCPSSEDDGLLQSDSPCKYLMKQLSRYPHDNGKQHTEYDHGCKRKIEAEIFFLYTDIAWQTPNPLKLVLKEIQHCAGCYQHQACNDQYFSQLSSHDQIFCAPMKKRAGKFTD